jgi:hypothetical protein
MVRALRAARWLVVSSAFAQASCAVCVPCEDTAEVSFDPPIREPGDYRIQVATSAGGSVSTCTLVISSSTAEADCSTLIIVWDAGQFVEVAGMFVHGAPSQIDVLVEKDGDVLADESLTPVYRERSACGDDCLSGSAQLVL